MHWTELTTEEVRALHQIKLGGFYSTDPRVIKRLVTLRLIMSDPDDEEALALTSRGQYLWAQWHFGLS
jgi:hypothetical protein